MIRRYVLRGVGVFVLVTLMAANGVSAKDVIVTNPQKSSLDKRFDHPIHLLNKALEITRREHGDFEVRPYPRKLARKRALRELELGYLSVFSAPTRIEWEQRAIPIRIPIRKGLMSYRIFLIRAADQKKFAAVRSIEALRRYRIGQGTQWSTAAALRKIGFTIHGTTEYEGLFTMLVKNRFDYFPRAISEIFTEFNLRTTRYPEMKIEETLALYLPLPYYYFVSPKRPDLAKRLETGLEALIANGEFDALFDSYYNDDIDRANLAGRRVFRLENKDLTAETPFHRKDYWYQP